MSDYIADQYGRGFVKQLALRNGRPVPDLYA
jgi:hypothetical protein